MNFDKLINYLKLDSKEFYFQFQSHPNYPSALALSDTFNFLNLKNDSYELEKEYWDELPDEFIALVDDKFSLVLKQSNDKYKLLSDDISTITKEELREKSQDFVLLYEKEISTKAKTRINYTNILLGLFALVILYSLINLKWFQTVYNVLSLLGVYVFADLFQQKFGSNSVMVSTICGGDTKNNADKNSCDQIISSDTTNVFGLKFADIGLAYFIGISFIGILLPESEVILKYLAISSVLVICYSLYIQVFVERKICKVCIVIIGLLIIQIAFSIEFFTVGSSIKTFFISLIFAALSFIAVLFLNDTMKYSELISKSNEKNLRFKRNYDLFKRELVRKEQIDFKEKEMFFIGGLDAKLHISIVSNPYCGFCKDAHVIVEDLLQRYPNDISAQLRFNYSAQNKDEKYTELMGGFVYLYKNKTQQEFLQYVHNWFVNRKEKEISAIGMSNDFEPIYRAASENMQLGFTFTPILFINGYQFPDAYDREDIFYFIDDLIGDDSFIEGGL